ncbi:MAG: ATP-binding cassette domain-containing protein [Rhodobacteraceae bacterium]|nr:ATP-binding cassette domain-containing protein [Paracoccaceae bacterium]
MAHLQIRNAGYKADGAVLLNPLSLELDCRGLTVILGANGAGKSLFLHLCHGMLEGHTGQVLWDNLPAEKSRRQRGFMFQHPAVLRRSVFANVEFALTAQGIPRGEHSQRVAEVLEQARLSHKVKTPAAALSGGEIRRMGLARALVTGPEVILMDEPAAGLDPASASALEQMVGEITSTGTGILMVSHDLAQARRLADRVLFFDGGSLIEDARADQFFANPASETATAYLEGRLL